MPWDVAHAGRLFRSRFHEVDLRVMLSAAIGYYEDHEEGRFVIEANHHGRRWHIIVEPDHLIQVLIVITAYPIG